MTKILLIGPFPPAVGGVTTSLHNIVYSDLANRHRFICFSNSRPLKKHPLGSHRYRDFFQGGIVRMFSGILVTLYHILSFPFVLRKVRPNIVQIHTSDYFVFWENSIYILISRLFRKKILVRMGGVFDKFYQNSNPFARFLVRCILKVPDILIVQSEYWKSFIGSLADPAKIRVVNNFLDVRAFPELSPRPEAESKRILFICGTEAMRKGLDVVLESVRYLSHDGIGTSRFVFVASNDQIQQRVKDLQVQPYIEFRGLLSKEEMLEEYRKADLFLLPSFGEGFPNSLLEAMASGLPIIATRVGAVPEVIEDRVNGLLIDAGDPGALTRAIKQVLHDPELRQRLGERGKEKVTTHYNVEKGVAQLDAIYAELLRGSSPGANG